MTAKIPDHIKIIIKELEEAITIYIETKQARDIVLAKIEDCKKFLRTILDNLYSVIVDYMP